jgi:chromosome segregation ATPase
LALCLASSPVFAQNSPPTPPLGSSDYTTFLADSLTVRVQLAASRQALELALAEKQSIKRNLADAQKRLDGLLSSATQHSDDSMLLYKQALAEVRKLKAQLNASQSSVDELRASLESKAAEYDRELVQAEVKAQGLERENRALKWLAGILAAASVALGVWIAVK